MLKLFINILYAIDRILAYLTITIYYAFFIFARVFKNKCKVIFKSKKTILFLCSGLPFRYPKEKESNYVFKDKWNKGFGSQLLHPTFDFSYALYLADKNSCYKLCPKIISISIKKISLKNFSRLSAAINTIMLNTAAKKLHKRINFYTIETFLPGDRLLNGLLLSIDNNVPLVVQCQGDFDLSSFDEHIALETYSKLINRNIQKFIFSVVLKHASLVLGYSDHCASFAICNGAAPQKVRRCRIQSFISDFDKIGIKDKKDLKGYSENKKIVFLWCRMAPEKKLNYAFDAMKKVLLRNPDIQFIISGDGPLKMQFENYFFDLKKKVIFLGNLDREELKSYIYHADVCLAPLAGHSIIEAAMCKKPVIGFNWEWHGEVITHNESGIIVDYPNIDDFEEAVLYLLRSPEAAANMGDKLYRRVYKMFDHKTVIAREEKIWNDFHVQQGKLL